MNQKHCHSVVYVRGSHNVSNPITEEYPNDCINEYHYLYPHKHLIYNTLQSIYGYFHLLYRVLKKHGKPQVIHAHVLLRTFLVGCALKLFLRIPLIFSEHWTGYRDGSLKKKSPLYLLLTKMAYKCCDELIVVSNRLGNDIVRNKLSKSFRVIPNIVSPAMKKKSNSNTDTIKFVTVADLNDYHKNISSIIKEIKALIPQYNLDYHIIGDGPDRKMLEELAGSFLNKKIFFHGMKSNHEVLMTLHEYDVLISNSHYETFGIVVIEALTAGLSVICTKEGCPDVVLNLPVGIFINPNSPDELKDAIRQMTINPDNFKTEACINTITDEFSANTIGQKLSAVYDSFFNR
jgi:glycosyltransferase involved in cell wall biosynthesis